MNKEEETELIITDVTTVDVYIDGENEFGYSTNDPSEIEVKIKDEDWFREEKK